MEKMKFVILVDVEIPTEKLEVEIVDVEVVEGSGHPIGNADSIVATPVGDPVVALLV